LSFSTRLRPDGVAVVTYEAPGRRENTLGRGFADELRGAVSGLARNGAVRAAVLCSAKTSSWMLGVAPEILAGLSTVADGEAFARDAQDAVASLSAAPFPFVAALDGTTLDLGLEVALGCDARVVTDRSRLAFRTVELGLSPCAGGLAQLTRLVGLERAAELALGGAFVSAEQARALGLAARITTPAALEEQAAELALRCAAEGRPKGDPGPFVGRISRLARERNPLFWRRAQARARSLAGLHHAAPRRVLDLLRGSVELDSAKALAAEARIFGELAVSSSAHRLLELAASIAEVRPEREIGARVAGLEALADEPPERPSVALGARVSPFIAHLLRAYIDALRSLEAEGVAAETVDRALQAWGFAMGPSSLRAALPADLTRELDAAPVPRARSPLRSTTEGLQMRCVSAVLAAAAEALDDGLVTDPREGDVAAVLDLGFPAFRGGPFRYMDRLGAREVLVRRAADTPDRPSPPRLVALAETRGRFHPVAQKATR
jgi:enoyl-CoA hydratase/carnithine racemase